MGIIVSRYMDPSSSEGALVKFIIDSLHLVRTVCTADTYFPELTPWNVIDFRGDDFHDTFSLNSLLGHAPPARPYDTQQTSVNDTNGTLHGNEDGIDEIEVEFEECATGVQMQDFQNVSERIEHRMEDCA